MATSSEWRAPPPPRGAVSFSRVLVDGVSVIESTTTSSFEAYLLPAMKEVDLETKLSASSSVFADVGAPDIRHLTSSSATIDEDEQSREEAAPSTMTFEDNDGANVPHLLSSPNDDDDERDGSFFARNVAAVDDEEDESSYTPSPVKCVRRTDVRSATAEAAIDAISSISLSDFSVPLCQQTSVFDFSQSIMPDIMPRRRRRGAATRNETRRDLSSALAPTPTSDRVAAPTPTSRYRRPVDSLLRQGHNNPHDGRHKIPSPVSAHQHAKSNTPRDLLPLNVHVRVDTSATPMTKKSSLSKHATPGAVFVAQQMMMQHCGMGSFFGENLNPQSPSLRHQKERKWIAIAAEPRQQTTAATTPPNVLKARRDRGPH